MKNRLFLGALLVSIASLFTACSDDNGSNPSLLAQPESFVLNTPAYVNEVVDLETTEELQLSWSQPVYTSDNAPLPVTYEIQVSPTNSFTVSTAEADADESGATVADYAVINRTTTLCTYQLQSEDLDLALMKIAKWEKSEVPETQKVYLRVNAFILENAARLNPVVSNVIELNTNPYYIELKDIPPIIWYLVGNNFGDGAWSNKPGISSFPMFMQADYTYDKTNGTGEIVYLNYFDTDGWKIQPADFNWDYGFMSGGAANTAVYRNGGGDDGNIWVEPAGYYLVTVNTAKNECTIVQQDITPTVYEQICITGSLFGWGDENMTPVNKNTENHVWSYILTVAEGSVETIKFKIPSSWDTNWGYGSEDGEVNVCGKGVANGKNIGVAEGTWVIMFNDITGEFSIIPAAE